MSVDPDAYCPWPAYADAWVSRLGGDFELPAAWLLQHGTAASAARGDKTALAHAAAIAGRRSLAEVLEEDRQIIASVNQQCNRCTHAEAIMHADLQAMKQLEGEWIDMQNTAAALIHAPAAAGSIKTEQKEGTAATAASSNRTIADLDTPRLCKRHRALLGRLLSSSSSSAAAAPAPLSSSLQQPTPQPRVVHTAAHRGSKDACDDLPPSSWAELDELTFARCYTLPEPRSRPATPPAIASVSMTGRIAPASVSSFASAAASASTPSAGAASLAASVASAAVAAAAAAASSPSSPSHKPRKTKGTWDRNKHLAIDMVAGAAGKPSSLDLPSSLTLSAEDEGRRSGRVSRIKMEAEQAELKRLEENMRRRAREAEEKQARQELDQIARIKQQQEGGGGGGSAASSSSSTYNNSSSNDAGVAPVSLLSFPSLLSRAAPEGLVDHASEYLSKSMLNGSASSSSSSQQQGEAPMCSVQLAMRLLEVSVFARDPAVLSKSCAPHAQGAFARALHTLRAALREEASIALPLPLVALKQSLLQPDLLGLTPLHVAIKLGCEEAVIMLLDELHEGAAALASAASAHSSDSSLADPQRSCVSLKAAATTTLKSTSPSPSPLTAAAAALAAAAASAPPAAAPPARRPGRPASRAPHPDSIEVQVQLRLKKQRVKDTDVVVYSNPAVVVKQQQPKIKVEAAAAQEQKSNSAPSPAPAPAAAAASNGTQQQMQFPALTPSALQAAESARRSALLTLRASQLQSRESYTGFSLTPLLYALAMGQSDDSTYSLLRALVDRGAFVLDTDAQGNDALMWSAQRGFQRCLQYLMAEATKATAAAAATRGERIDLSNAVVHDELSAALLAARNDLGNTALHAAIASAMDAECAGCVECVSIHVADIPPDEEIVPTANNAATTMAEGKDAMEDEPAAASASPSPSPSPSPSAVAAPLFTSTRLLPVESVPPFVLPLLLRLQPLLQDPTLERVVRETLWKGELRIRPGVIEEPTSAQMAQQISSEEQRRSRRNKEAAFVSASASAAQRAEAADMEIEEEHKESSARSSPATAAAAGSSSSSPSPLPTLPASTLPLPPLFVALLRLWRQLLHRDSKLVSGPAAGPHLSPLVAELASLLPLTLFLEAAASTTGRRSKGQQEIVLVRTPEPRCRRAEAAGDCIKLLRDLGAGGNYEEARNKHGLTPANLLERWSELGAAPASAAAAASPAAAARTLAAQQWRAQLRALWLRDGWDMPASGAAAIPKLKQGAAAVAAAAMSDAETTAVEWGPTRYFDRHLKGTASAATGAASAVDASTALSSPCDQCGAGMLAPCPSTPAHAAPPSCVCYSHPTFEPTPAALSSRVLKQTNLWNGEQKEPLLLPVLNALDGTAPAPSGPTRMYSRTALYSEGDLHKERIVAQANTLTPSCKCGSGGCNPLSGCACSRHRFGTADPVHATATAAAARSTVTCLFECHRLCGCRCSLGGPHTLDLRRFEPRARTQLLRHISGWRLHTLEPLVAGSFFCEYSAEVLSGSASRVRGLEYSYSFAPQAASAAGAADRRRSGNYLLRVVHTTPQAPPPAPATATPKTPAEMEKRDKLAQSIASVAISSAHCSWVSLDAWPDLAARFSLFSLLCVCLPVFSFDASRFGNLCSFVRHACSGNLVPVLLYTAASHVPRIMLMAGRDIERGEELTMMHDAQDCVKQSMHIKTSATINLYAA